MLDHFPSMWTIDFVRAYNERHFIFQILTRIFLGKYACRELDGLIEWLYKCGWNPYYPYSLEDMDYHTKKGDCWWFPLPANMMEFNKWS